MEPMAEPSVLISKIIRGDESAFKQLFDLYYQKLFHVAFYFLKSKEQGEEVVADVFFNLWTRRAALRSVGNMESYLYITTRNQALLYLKKQQKQTEMNRSDLYALEWVPDSTTPELSLLDREYEGLIQQAVHSLPEKCREVFRLVLSDKLKHKDIAQLLNISEKTVEAHISHAYKRIADYVNRSYHD
jgi:RNA polymerase sigma-70 factor (ECF subfamily)